MAERQGADGQGGSGQGGSGQGGSGQGGSGRDLSRRRSRRYPAHETGRQHHLGGPPEQAPVHTDEGVTLSATTDARLRELPPGLLDALGADVAAQMRDAAADLEFERAAELREQLLRVQGEQTRRAAPQR